MYIEDRRKLEGLLGARGSDEASMTLWRWMQGIDFPGIGSTEWDEHFWLLSAARGDEAHPDITGSLALLVADTVLLLAKDMNILDSSREAEEGLYNLLRVCASLGYSGKHPELADALEVFYGEVADNKRNLGRYRGVEVVVSLRDALSSNQNDTGYLRDWIAMLEGEERAHPVLGGGSVFARHAIANMLKAVGHEVPEGADAVAALRGYLEKLGTNEARVHLDNLNRIEGKVSQRENALG